MSKLKFMLFVFLVVLSSHSHSQINNKPDNVIIDIQKEINKINSQVNNGTNNIKTEFQRKISELKKIVDKHYQKYIILSQKDSICRKSFSIILNNLIVKENDLNNIKEIIEDLKAKNSSLILGIESNPLSEIKIEVTTVDKNFNPIRGYYIYWNFWLDKDSTSAYSNFNNPTNPITNGYLYPGIYDIWAEKINEKKRYPLLANRIKTEIVRRRNQTKIQLQIIVE